MFENRPMQNVSTHRTTILSISRVGTPSHITLRMFILGLFASSNLLTWAVVQKLFVNIPDASRFGELTTIFNTQGV